MVLTAVGLAGFKYLHIQGEGNVTAKKLDALCALTLCLQVRETEVAENCLFLFIFLTITRSYQIKLFNMPNRTYYNNNLYSSVIPWLFPSPASNHVGGVRFSRAW